MKKILFLSALLLVINLLSHNYISIGIAAEITLLWDANDEDDLAGYAVYQSTDSPGPPYDLVDKLLLDELSDQDKPEALVTQLEDGKKYFFFVKAFDKSNNKSSFSNRICVEVEGANITDCPKINESIFLLLLD
jgi:hypothetical protein